MFVVALVAHHYVAHAFGIFIPFGQMLAFSLAAHLVFASTRAFLGVLWLPVAYFDLVPKAAEAER